MRGWDVGVWDLVFRSLVLGFRFLPAPNPEELTLSSVVGHEERTRLDSIAPRPKT